MVLSWSYEDLRADGVSLKNFGFGVSLVGGLSGVPPRVGSNIPISGRRGTQFRKKQFTEINRTLTMWIDSRNPETGLYPPGWRARIGQRNENLQFLSRILGKLKSQIKFERDVILKDGYLDTWFAYGEYVGDALTPNWSDNSDEETNFSIDLLFADPFWYGRLYTSPTMTAGAGNAAIVNSGDLEAIDSTITITASTTLVNPVVTNSTNGISFTLTTTLNAADSIVVDTKYPRVKRTSDNANLIGTLTNVGSRSFMEFDRGTNNVALTATSGTGTAVAAFYPPHF